MTILPFVYYFSVKDYPALVISLMLLPAVGFCAVFLLIFDLIFKKYLPLLRFNNRFLRILGRFFIGVFLLVNIFIMPGLFIADNKKVFMKDNLPMIGIYLVISFILAVIIRVVTFAIVKKFAKDDNDGI